MRKETQKHFDNIMDCMAGADGGGRFLRLKFMIEDMDKRADKGEVGAQQIVDVMVYFSRLIDVANKKDIPQQKKKEVLQ